MPRCLHRPAPRARRGLSERNKLLMTRRLIFLLLAIVVGSSRGMASDTYARLMQSAVGRPSSQILDMASRASAGKDERRALVLYLVVCNRSRHAATERDRANCALAYLRAGDIYYWRGHYAKALSMYLQGQKICESTRGKAKIVEFYKCFGNVYCMFKEYDQAVNFYLKGYSLRDRYPDPEMTYRLLNNLCHTCYLMGNAREAEHFYRLAQRTPHAARPDFQFYDRFYRAVIEKMNRRHDRAIAILRPLVSFSESRGLPPRYLCGVYEELYKTFQAKGDADSTLHYMSLCLATAERTRQMHMFTETLGEMSRAYARHGDRRLAALFKRRYDEVADSVFNQSEFSKAKSQQFVYEMDKIDKEIAALTAESDSRQDTIRLQWLALASGLGVLAVVLVLLFVVYRQKQRLKSSYHDLYTINQRLVEVQHRLDEANNSGKYSSSNLADDRKQDLIKTIANIMDTTLEYAEPDFSLERLATLAGSNSKYVSQAINDGYGKNFSNFVNEYRIRLACRRLADQDNFGNLTIRSIGASVGYRSNTTFVGVFRRLTGMTPSEYQRTAREENEE